MFLHCLNLWCILFRWNVFRFYELVEPFTQVLDYNVICTVVPFLLQGYMPMVRLELDVFSGRTNPWVDVPLPFMMNMMNENPPRPMKKTVKGTLHARQISVHFTTSMHDQRHHFHIVSLDNHSIPVFYDNFLLKMSLQKFKMHYS